MKDKYFDHHIIPILFLGNAYNNIKKRDRRQLNYFYENFKLIFQNNSGAWSIKEYKSFCVYLLSNKEAIKINLGKDINIQIIVQGLIDFHRCYQERSKKKLKGFESFLKKVITSLKEVGLKKTLTKEQIKQYVDKEILPPEYLEVHKSIELKKGVNIKDFLVSMQEVKNNFLKGSDEALLDMIHDHINIEYKRSTLEKYYYGG